eukprot:365661-Chlamydomonas_euryale.AAC.19
MQGERPLHAAASAAIKEALQCWDEAETDRILASWQTRKEDAAAAEEAERMATVQTAEVEVATSKTDFDNAQVGHPQQHAFMQQNAQCDGTEIAACVGCEQVGCNGTPSFNAHGALCLDPCFLTCSLSYVRIIDLHVCRRL